MRLTLHLRLRGFLLWSGLHLRLRRLSLRPHRRLQFGLVNVSPIIFTHERRRFSTEQAHLITTLIVIVEIVSNHHTSFIQFSLWFLVSLVVLYDCSRHCCGKCNGNWTTVGSSNSLFFDNLVQCSYPGDFFIRVQSNKHLQENEWTNDLSNQGKCFFFRRVFIIFLCCSTLLSKLWWHSPWVFSVRGQV